MNTAPSSASDTRTAIAPASSDQLRTLVRDAMASRTSLRIVGGGTWLDAGRPVHGATAVSTRALRDVVEYVPGDLVITVGAGITLAELEAITAPHGQWLALDPYVSPDGLTHATIGAAVATASSGPLSLGFGRVRDLVLGVSFVSGEGLAIRGGGRVVKNVAGFDLVRLTTGAWGTLGIITEVSLRLHARPAVDETFAIVIDVPHEPTAHDRALARVIESINQPPLLAATSSLASLLLLPPRVLHAPAHRHTLPSDALVMLVRAVGNRARVDALRRALSALGTHLPIDPSIWDAVRGFERGNTSFRVPGTPGTTAASLRALQHWCAREDVREGPRDVTMVIDPMRGLIRVSCDLPDATGEGLGLLPDRAIPERLPAAAWPSRTRSADDPLSRQLRARFDPADLLNPGIFGAIGASPLAEASST